MFEIFANIFFAFVSWSILVSKLR